MSENKSTCVVCGKEFYAPRGGQYCSQACQKRDYRTKMQRECIDEHHTYNAISSLDDMAVLQVMAIGLSGINSTSNAKADISLALQSLKDKNKDLEWQLKSLEEKYLREGEILLELKEKLKGMEMLEKRIKELERENDDLQYELDDLREYKKETSTSLGKTATIATMTLSGLTEVAIAKYGPKFFAHLPGLMGDTPSEPAVQPGQQVQTAQMPIEEEEPIVEPIREGCL